MNKQSKLASWQQLVSDAKKPAQVELVQEKPKVKEIVNPIPVPVLPVPQEEVSLPEEGIGLSDYLKSQHPVDEDVRPAQKHGFQKKLKKNDE